MYDIVRFKTDSGEDLSVTREDVKNVLCPQANDKEIFLFLSLCKAQRLNPFIREAYLVKYGNAPASIITGKDVFVKRANANPIYEGIEYGVVFIADKKVQRREGSAVYAEANERLIGGWARVFLKGKKPVYSEVTIAEYSTGKALWATKPAVMITKCAQVNALRLAFPSEFSQLYTAEEMGSAGDFKAPDPVAIDPVEVIDVEADAMTADQAQEIDSLCLAVSHSVGVEYSSIVEKLFACNAMIEAGASQSESLTETQASIAVRILGKWREQAEKRAEEARIKEVGDAVGVEFVKDDEA